MMGPPMMAPPMAPMGGMPHMMAAAPPQQPRPLRPPLAASAVPMGPPGRSTTLWVGRIAQTVDGPFVQQLLEACGKLREWKPVTEPETGKLKGFGFVTYAEPEGVLVALQVLNNLKVDGQELALKCNKATEEYLEWFKKNKQQEKEKQKAAGEADGSAAGSEPAPDADAAENAALGRVMELISQRPAIAAPKSEPASAAAAADTFLSNLSASKDQAGGAGGEPGSRGERGASSVDRKREREAERDAERERQRQRREEQRKAEEYERAYREAVRQWEDHERLRQRDGDKERERQADLVRERQRQVHADNEAADTDEEEEPWRRRPHSGSRRAAERRRRRDLEQQDDQADRQREAAEQEAAAQAAAEAAEAEAASRPASAAADQAEADKGSAFGADDTILQAMLAAVKAKPEPVAAPAAEAQVVTAPAAKRKAPAAFVEEEEEEKPQRRLIPIRYSEEELKALQQPADEPQAEAAVGGPPAGSGAAAAAQPVAAPKSVDPAAVKKQLLQLIPKDKAGVFAFQLNWAVLDNGPPDVKDKISGWVAKKVSELLGEEPSFCRFIMEQLAAHVSAGGMLEALGDVLDEDAEAFTLKLWQILIYEQLKLERMPPQ